MIISVVNQKGGVAKTTSVFNMGVEFARWEKSSYGGL